MKIFTSSRNNRKIFKIRNKISLKAKIIKVRLTCLRLFRLARYWINKIGRLIVRISLVACRTIVLIFITNQIKQMLKLIIVSQVIERINNGALVGVVARIYKGNMLQFCDFDSSQIQKLKQKFQTTDIPQAVLRFPDSSANNFISAPFFNDEIPKIMDIISVPRSGHEVFTNEMIDYTPKFTIDYVIERLVIGDDITKLPHNHITNLWWYIYK